MSFFNTEAKNYDGWYNTKLGCFVDEVETECAFTLFNSLEGQTILDVGCGTGNFSLKLAAKGAQVIGIDLSSEMLNIAKEKADKEGQSIDFREMDLYQLQFPDNYFDAVFSMAAFEFVQETELALQELFRVLKPGGQLLVGTIHLDSPWGKLYTSKAFQENTVFKYAHFKTLEEMASYFPEKLRETKECLFLPPDTAEVCINLETEKKHKTLNRGGFICLLWEK